MSGGARRDTKFHSRKVQQGRILMIHDERSIHYTVSLKCFITTCNVLTGFVPDHIKRINESSLLSLDYDRSLPHSRRYA